ncbi:MAG: bifunctional ornithine acetyltransferase/N-acetylglutamate synthase, partial [Pseudomonadales bacterium]|nr:bifunctional ornithine acetyltransferase/N-acetylglutamate synthase [Pseudomonadales bacterium]
MATGEVSLSFNPVSGVRLAATAAGVRSDGRDDLVLMEFTEGSTAAAVYTKSLFAAAPVQVGKRHLAITSPRYFLTNSGNANAAVGEGVAAALARCAPVAKIPGA